MIFCKGDDGLLSVLLVLVKGGSSRISVELKSSFGGPTSVDLA